jgi:hypothetical protein
MSNFAQFESEQNGTFTGTMAEWPQEERPVGGEQ